MIRGGQHNIRETSRFMTIILFLLGVVAFILTLLTEETLPLLGSDGSWQRELLESLSVFLLSVVLVSWLYGKFLIEKHFNQFGLLLEERLRMMDTIQSKCLDLGITELFATRKIYEQEYPFAQVIASTKSGGRILCVGRSLFHLLNKEAELKTGLEKGIQFDLMVLDPVEVTEKKMRDVLPQIQAGDIQVALGALEDLLDWTQKRRPKGGIEVRFHHLYLPDSIFMAETKTKNEPFLIWDLSFGRDLTEKCTLKLEGGYGMGKSLIERYEVIWGKGDPKFKLENGIITRNDLDQVKNG